METSDSSTAEVAQPPVSEIPTDLPASQPAGDVPPPQETPQEQPQSAPLTEQSSSEPITAPPPQEYAPTDTEALEIAAAQIQAQQNAEQAAIDPAQYAAYLYAAQQALQQQQPASAEPTALASDSLPSQSLPAFAQQPQSISDVGSKEDDMQIDDAASQPRPPATFPGSAPSGPGPMRGPERSRREEPYPPRTFRGGKDPIEVLKDTFTLYIAGVPPDVSEPELMAFFADCHPRGCRIPRFDDSGKAKGFAFVEFNNFDEAKKAWDTRAHVEFRGRPVKMEPSDTPIRHHDTDSRPPRERERRDRDRDYPRDRDRDRDRSGWDRDRPPPPRGADWDRRGGDDHRRGGDDRRDRDRDRRDPRDSRGYRDDRDFDSAPRSLSMLFIGNIADSVTERELGQLFSTIGPVRSVRLLTDRTTNRFRGCGFLDMENPEDASRAFALSGTPLHGKPIRVDYSQNERAGERPPERDRDPYPPRDYRDPRDPRDPRDSRDRDRDRDRPRDPRDREEYSRPRSPPRHSDYRGAPPPTGPPPPRGPAPPSQQPSALDFAQLAQVPGLLSLLNPQAAALAASVAPQQQMPQQQPSNDLSALLRSLGGQPTAPPSMPTYQPQPTTTDASMAYLQAILAGTGAAGLQQQQQPMSLLGTPNPFSAPQQQSNPLASLLGLSAPPVPHQQHQQLQQHQQQQHQHQMQLQQQPPSHQHQQQHHQQSPSMHQHQPPYQPPSIIPQRPYSPQAPQSDDFRRQKNPTAQPISKRPPGCKSIFLAALPDSTTDADIHALFESCGKIEAIRWLNDRVTGRFRGCGFVDFSDDVAPVKAVNFNGYLLHGVPIRVDYAIPRRDDERDNRR